MKLVHYSDVFVAFVAFVVFLALLAVVLGVHKLPFWIGLDMGGCLLSPIA